MPSWFCTECDQPLSEEAAVSVKGTYMHQKCYLKIMGRRLRTTPLSVLHPPRRAA